MRRFFWFDGRPILHDIYCSFAVSRSVHSRKRQRNHWQQYDAWRASNVSGMANYLIQSGKVE